MRLGRSRRSKPTRILMIDDPLPAPAVATEPAAASPEAAARPPIDEWGFYDPDVAGFRALMAALETATPAPDGQPDEEPAELLFRQADPHLSLPTEAIAPEPTPGAADAAITQRSVASTPVPHLVPLALWARADEPLQEAVVTVTLDAWQRWKKSAARASGEPWQLDGYTHASGSEVAAILGRWSAAAQVATTPAGRCAIREVRVLPPACERRISSRAARTVSQTVASVCLLASQPVRLSLPSGVRRGRVPAALG